jgi:ATP-dependent DNA helicase RecQ
MKQRAESLLRQMLGGDACFREGQFEAIEELVARRGRILVVQKTGWGKSIVYFIATRMLRDQGRGPTLLISPLLSLMRNQLEMAARLGIRAQTINSENSDHWGSIERELHNDACDILLVSPERLANERFHAQTRPAIRRGIGLFVVDEAHCISDWGHDFRPDYRRIVRVVRALPANVPLLATTATANDRVIADIQRQLGPELRVRRGGLARESLRLQAISLPSQAERLAWLADNLPKLPGSGIVYCLTVPDCDRVAAWLQSCGISAYSYHASIPQPQKVELEQRLLRNQVKTLVATVALGMGFDKPDLHFVVHYQRPGSAIAYYQQIGRAGRALERAPVILLHGTEEDEIHDYFIRTAFPVPAESMALLDALEHSDTGLTLYEVLRAVNLSKLKAEKALKLLEVEGAVVREDGRYLRTPNPWFPDEPRMRQLTTLRRAELQQMRIFAQTPQCLMEFLQKELNDPTARPCGQCANCAGAVVSPATKPERVAAAEEFLKGIYRHIAPRTQWPPHGTPPFRGKIAPALVNAEGRALCTYGDAGWGMLVKTGKYYDGRFSDELVTAAAGLVRNRWQPAPFPRWITAIPSLRHGRLVADFAVRLGAALGLPFRPALRKLRDNPEQKLMQNSTQQLGNLIGVFAAVPSSILPGPVLLVDDMVDSGWTLTYAGMLLRQAGSGPVYPFALATSASGGDTA